MASVQVHPQHPAVRVLVHALAVVAGGFVLLNVAFVVYAGAAALVRAPSVDGAPDGSGRPLQRLVVTGGFLAVLGLVTWFLMRRWPDALGTAVWLSVPTGAVLVTIGVAAAPSTLLAITIGTLLTVGAVASVLWTHRPWEQVLAVAWVAVALAVMIAFGVEI